MPHAARPLCPWLIFDVRHNTSGSRVHQVMCKASSMLQRSQAKVVVDSFCKGSAHEGTPGNPVGF